MISSVSPPHCVRLFVAEIKDHTLVPTCDVRHNFRMKSCSVRLYLQLLVGGLISYLRYLCLFPHIGVQYIVLCYCFVLLGLVYHMLSVSLDCPCTTYSQFL